MRYILYFVFGLLLLSCTGGNKRFSYEEKYKLFMDSIFRADSIFKDSLKSVIGDEAIGQIKFGMDKRRFERAKQAFLDSIYTGLGYFVNGTQITDVEPYFNEDGMLYRIVVTAPGVYEIDEPDDIYRTRAFVDYLESKYGKSKNDKGIEWIVGSTSFIKRPSNLSAEKKWVKNPEWFEGSNKERYVYKVVVYCSMNLEISNSKYAD